MTGASNMPILTLTVARIDPPRPNGGKNGKIVGTSGETIYAPPSKTAKFIPGHSYEVDYSTSEWKGQNYNNLESFHEVERSKAPTSTTHSSGGGSSGVFRTPKQLFVSEVLTAYIAAGRCEPQKLTETINYIAAAWDCTLGGNPPQQHLEAAE